jgi:hypothetical protein
MSLLTDALTYVKLHLEEFYPAGVLDLQEGLTIAEAEKITEVLPFKLPFEVYELYQWAQPSESPSNCSYIFSLQEMSFLQLQSSVENLPYLDSDTFHFFKNPLFPLFELDGEFLCTVGSLEQVETAPIIHVSEELDVRVAYVSLTSMILTMQDHFKEELIEVKNTNYNPDVMLLSYKISERRSSQIYQKYNPDLPELAISSFCQGIQQLSSEPLAISIALDSFVNQISYLKSDWQELSIEGLSPNLKRDLMALLQHENKKIRITAKKNIGETWLCLSAVWF